MSSDDRTMRRLRWAAVLAVVALFFIVWSLFDPTPMPIVISMSVGQLVGTLSFGLYLAVVLPELWRSLRAQSDESASDSQAAEPATTGPANAEEGP